MIVPVILAGGTGSRLWPVSRSTYPKQLLPLVSQRTMLQDTVLRIRLIPSVAPPIVICNQEHRFLVAEQLQAIGIKNAVIILEPIGKNTAPAAAIAAFYCQEQDPLLLILPADHYIKDIEEFTAAVNIAAIHAKRHRLVTFGVVPTRAETGYGYIQISPSEDEVYPVNQFVEKPALNAAQSYLESGLFFWNSGMFMFSASQYLSELKRYAPLIFEQCKKTLSHMTHDLDFIRLGKEQFASCPSDSIDYAIMEKTQNAVLVPFKADWSDIGSWAALCEVHEQDANGNVIQGDVIAENIQHSYLRAESRMLAAVGLCNHIVIETPDVVLVAHKDHCQDIKQIVAQLKQLARPEVEWHQQIYRPWGHYETLISSHHFQVKRIHIKPFASLSLQVHQHRSEHWVVVKGTAEVTRGDEIFRVQENQSTYIPKEVKHRLLNPTEDDLVIIEIQLGNYLGEDDIVRFEDTYGRAASGE